MSDSRINNVKGGSEVFMSRFKISSSARMSFLSLYDNEFFILV